MVQPEPAHAHGSAATHGRRSLQPRHARGAHAGGRAPLPRRVPERFARGRDPARAVVADPARHRPAHAAGALGAQVRQHLDARRLAAQGLDREAGAAARGLSRPARPPGRRPLRDALRHAVDRQRARCGQGGRRRQGAGPAALPAVRGIDDGEHRRRARGLDAARPQPARDPLRQALPRRPGLHRRARPARRRALAGQRPPRQARPQLPRPAAALADARRSVPLRVP